MDAETTVTSSTRASAFELLAILALIAAVFVFRRSPDLFVAAIVLTLLMLGAAFFFRYATIVADEKREKGTLRGSALVDERVLRALETAAMPLLIIRAVESVGSQESLHTFRKLLRKECLNDITEEQLDAVIRLVRVRVLAPPPPPTVVPPSAPSSEVAPSTPDLASTKPDAVDHSDAPAQQKTMSLGALMLRDREGDGN